jgi:pantothenate synthetase
MTTLIEIYKGIEIRHESDKQDSHPFVTVQFVPVIGALQTGHKTLKGAKQYIDKL